MRPTIDSLMPRRSSATAAGSKPRPVSRTKPVSSASSASTNTSTRSTSAWRAALTTASRTAATSAREASSSGWSPTTTASTRMSWSASMADGEGVDGGVQRRRLALVRRAVQPRPQLALLAPGDRRHPPRVVVRCISTSDCSTESWRWAAIRRPLVLADARRPLVVEAPQQAAERRRGEDGQAADDDGDGARRRADAGRARRVRLASEATPATSSATPTTTCSDAHGRRRRRVGRAPPPSDQTIEMPTATAAAGTMIAVARPQPDRPAGDEHGAGRAADGQLAPPAVPDGSGRGGGALDAVGRERRRRRRRARRRARRPASAARSAARTTVGSTPQRSAHPLATPARTRSDPRGHAQGVGHVRHTLSLARRRAVDHQGRPAGRAGVSGIDQGHPRWRGAPDVRTVVVVDLAPPPADAAPAPAPPPADEPAPPERDRRRGRRPARRPPRRRRAVAAHRVRPARARRRRRPRRSTARCGWRSSSAPSPAGAGPGSPAASLLVVGLPLAADRRAFDFFDGPVAVLALLVGLAVALWQPRQGCARRRRPGVGRGAGGRRRRPRRRRRTPTGRAAPRLPRGRRARRRSSAA